MFVKGASRYFLLMAYLLATTRSGCLRVRPILRKREFRRGRGLRRNALEPGEHPRSFICGGLGDELGIRRGEGPDLLCAVMQFCSGACEQDVCLASLLRDVDV